MCNPNEDGMSKIDPKKFLGQDLRTFSVEKLREITDQYRLLLESPDGYVLGQMVSALLVALGDPSDPSTAMASYHIDDLWMFNGCSATKANRESN